MKKKGRPLGSTKPNTKRNNICFKVSDDEYMMISEIALDLGITKQEYIRRKVFSFKEE